ncbi:MAG: Flp pilus assembly complex ATPase component TadA [Myxococcales bacterium]|nr:Flp pilus assembly complex ATPase component TadA [Myxococcales bacterium]
MAIAVPTIERAARATIVLALLAAGVGVVALLLSSDAANVSEFGALFLWYAKHRFSGNLVLIGFCGLAALSAVALFFARLRAGFVWNRDLQSGAVPSRQAGAFSTDQLVREARAALEPYLGGRPRIGETVDAMLGLPVDLAASELLIDGEPGDGKDDATISLRMAMTRVRVATMSSSLMALVLDELRAIAGIDGEFGEGSLELRQQQSSESMRVVIAQAAAGTRVRLQVMSHMAIALTLEELQMPTQVLQSFARALEQRSGLVAIVGPRGQGVTTTVYAAAHYIDRYRKEPGLIASVEAPVRHDLPFVHQTEVREGISGARVLESLVARGHGVLIVRQVDDRETARIAVEASRERLVVLTINEGRWRDALSWLREASGALPATTVVGQRLVRRVCASCAEASELGERERELLAKGGVSLGVSVDPKVGAGCRSCRRTGYVGRMPLYELVQIDGGADLDKVSAHPTLEGSLRDALDAGETSAAEALALVEQLREQRA